MMLALAFASLRYLPYKLRAPHAIGLVLVLLAVYYAVVTELEKWRVHRTRSWPTAAGNISDVRTEFEPGGTNGVDYWRVYFKYTYTVDSAEYTGEYHVNCVKESLAQSASAGLSSAQALVHYDPQKPAHSVLWEDEVWDLW